MGEHRLLADFRCLEAEGALLDDGAGEDLVASLLFDGYGFAGDHRFIDVGGGIAYHRAIDGDTLPWAYLDGVARLEGGDGGIGDGAAVYEVGRLRLESHQAADGGGGAVLGALLQETSCQHEGDDHDGSVEPRMPDNAATAPHLFAEEGVEGAEQEGDARGECHERVHVGAAVDELLPGCDVELPSAVDDVQQREDEHRLVGEVVSLSQHYPMHRDSHHQQGEEPGDDNLVP